jgi:UDP-N-acetylmuramate-alanine ligase
LLIVSLPPHRYSRTQDLFDAFSHALSKADGLILLEVYPANERPIANTFSGGRPITVPLSVFTMGRSMRIGLSTNKV